MSISAGGDDIDVKSPSTILDSESETFLETEIEESSQDAGMDVAVLQDLAVGTEAELDVDYFGAFASGRELIHDWSVRAEDDGLEGLQFWCGRCLRLVEIYSELKTEPRIICNFGSLGRLFPRALDVIYSRLDVQYFSAFKVGHTHVPLHRFLNDSYGYAHSGYTQMILVTCSDNSYVTAALETKLIAVFRKFDRDENLVNRSGHPLCLNRAKGGENCHIGAPPCFVYLVLRGT